MILWNRILWLLNSFFLIDPKKSACLFTWSTLAWSYNCFTSKFLSVFTKCKNIGQSVPRKITLNSNWARQSWLRECWKLFFLKRVTNVCSEEGRNLVVTEFQANVGPNSYLLETDLLFKKGNDKKTWSDVRQRFYILKRNQTDHILFESWRNRRIWRLLTFFCFHGFLFRTVTSFLHGNGNNSWSFHWKNWFYKRCKISKKCPVRNLLLELELIQPVFLRDALRTREK